MKVNSSPILLQFIFFKLICKANLQLKNKTQFVRGIWAQMDWKGIIKTVEVLNMCFLLNITWDEWLNYIMTINVCFHMTFCEIFL